MNLRLSVSLVVLGVAAACATPPPEVYSALETSTDLRVLNPADIAVLPIEDATPEHVLGATGAAIRQAVAVALVQRRYSPLAPAAVDRALGGEGPREGSIVDAGWLRSVGGELKQDATLAIRITRWDRSALMSRGIVQFSAEVALVSPQREQPLWSGTLRGAVRAGGSGPAPLDHASRDRSTAQEFGKELIRRLPRREP